MRVGNKPLVQNNTVSGKANNVYLPSGKTLTIEIGMSKGASIGVTTANTSYPVAFSNDYKKTTRITFSRMTPMPTWSIRMTRSCTLFPARLRGLYGDL